MGSEPGDLREAKCLENWKSTLDASKYSNHHLAQRWYLDILKTYPGNLHSGPPIHPQAKMLIHRFCVDLRKDLSQQRVQGKQTWYKMVYACTDCKKRTKPWQLSYLSSSLSKRSICACVCARMLLRAICSGHANVPGANGIPFHTSASLAPCITRSTLPSLALAPALQSAQQTERINTDFLKNPVYQHVVTTVRSCLKTSAASTEHLVDGLTLSLHLPCALCMPLQIHLKNLAQHVIQRESFFWHQLLCDLLWTFASEFQKNASFLAASGAARLPGTRTLRKPTITEFTNIRESSPSLKHGFTAYAFVRFCSRLLPWLPPAQQSSRFHSSHTRLCSKELLHSLKTTTTPNHSTPPKKHAV